MVPRILKMYHMWGNIVKNENVLMPPHSDALCTSHPLRNFVQVFIKIILHRQIAEQLNVEFDAKKSRKRGYTRPF